MKSGDSDDTCNSDDQLPDGWTVKVKVRPCGKKDKCYFPPSGEGKFYSRLDIVRYLNKNNQKSEAKGKGIDQHSSQNVTFEKSEPDGLPPGWTKEIKVTKKGKKIRKDPFYTDPVSGYVFRSMKDALRYLETGELGRLAFKPKDKSNESVVLEDDKDCSPAATKKQKLALDRPTSPIISDQSSKLLEVAVDKHVPRSAGTGQSMPLYELTSHHCEAGSQSNSSAVQEDKGKIGKYDPEKSVMPSAEGALSKEHLPESETIKDENKGTAGGKSKEKKVLHLPCRASKRLAGLPHDPTPELKTPNRAHWSAVKQSCNEASTGGDTPQADNEARCASHTSKDTARSIKANKSECPTGNSAASCDHVGKAETEKRVSEMPVWNLVEMESKGSQKHGSATVSVDSGKFQTHATDDDKPNLQLDLPLGELWQDPCIAFAIKTLTGISFDTTDSIQASSGSNNSELGGLATLEDNGRKEDAQNVVQSLNNVGTQEEHVSKIEINNKDDGKPGSPLDLWADPCIAFAIKTLTGAIPLDCDIAECIQHKASSSSQSQESSGLTVQNVGETGQSRFLGQQFGIQERPVYHQQALMEPGFGHSKNVDAYSDGTIHLQPREERSKTSQR